MSIPADRRDPPSGDVVLRLDKLAEPLGIHELPLAQVMKGGDLVLERELCPLDGLFGSSKTAVGVGVPKIVLSSEMVLPVVEIDAAVESQGVEKTLDEVGHDAGLVVLKVGLQRLGLEAAHAERLVKDKEELADGSELPHLAKALGDGMQLYYGRCSGGGGAGHSAERASRRHVVWRGTLELKQMW